MRLFIVCSPAAFLAFNYIIYRRVIVSSVGEKHSVICPTIVAKVFILTDVTTFLVQIRCLTLLFSKLNLPSHRLPAVPWISRLHQPN